MDPSDIFLSPYKFLGFIWVVNLLLFYLIFKAVAFSRTVPERVLVANSSTGRYKKGFTTHKYLIEMARLNPGDNPVPFIEFVHKEILFNISYAFGIKISEVVNMLGNTDLLKNIFYDKEIRFFLLSPVEWMKQFPYKKKRFLIFTQSYISPELQKGIILMIHQISTIILSRSDQYD